jgi:hypothetical protein
MPVVELISLINGVMDVYLQVLDFRVAVLRRLDFTRMPVSCMRWCSPAVATATAIAQCLPPPAAQKPRIPYQTQVIKKDVRLTFL